MAWPVLESKIPASLLRCSTTEPLGWISSQSSLNYHICIVGTCSNIPLAMRDFSLSTTHLNPILPSVYIVSQEQEGGWGQKRAHPPKGLFKTHQISVVPMYVSCIDKNIIILNICISQNIAYTCTCTSKIDNYQWQSLISELIFPEEENMPNICSKIIFLCIWVSKKLFL